MGHKRDVGFVGVKCAYIVKEFFKIYPGFLSCNLESDLGLSDEGY